MSLFLLHPLLLPNKYLCAECHKSETYETVNKQHKEAWSVLLKKSPILVVRQVWKFDDGRKVNTQDEIIIALGVIVLKNALSGNHPSQCELSH